MSERWARTILSAYRWAGAAAYPFIGTYVAWRTAKGKEDNSRRRERYGIAGKRAPGRAADLDACGERRRDQRRRAADRAHPRLATSTSC